jgi:hypothetical protein
MVNVEINIPFQEGEIQAGFKSRSFVRADGAEAVLAEQSK